MNRQRIDSFLPAAIEAIKTTEIANKGGKVSNTFRGYISRFGATVAMGSLLSAIAAFRQQNSAKEDRGKLIEAMEKILKTDNLFDYARTTENAKDIILDAALAIKLALNFYDIQKGEKKDTADSENDAGGEGG